MTYKFFICLCLGSAVLGAQGLPVNSLSNPQHRVAYQTMATMAVLQAELALQRDDVTAALAALAQAVRISDDPVVARRATEIAIQAGNEEATVAFAKRWLLVSSAEVDKNEARGVLASVVFQQSDADVIAQELLALLPQVQTDTGEMAPLRERALADLMRGLLRGNRPELLVRVAEKMARLEKTNAGAYFGLAVAQYAWERQIHTAPKTWLKKSAGKINYESIHKNMDTCLALRPEWAEAAALKTELLFDEDPQSIFAETFATAYIARHPKAWPVHKFLAGMLYEQKKFTESRTVAKAAIALGSPSAGDDTTRNQINDLKLQAAFSALALREFVTAESELQTLLTDVSLSKSKNRIRLQLSYLYEAQKKWDKALEVLQLVEPDSEQWREAQLRTASHLGRLGQVEAALDLLEQLTPENNEQAIELVQQKAAILSSAKEYQRAFDVLEKAIKATTKIKPVPEWLYDQAMLADKLKRYEHMERLLKQVIDLQPENAHAHNALGYSFVERNIQLADATRLLEHAYALAPRDPAIIDSMGWLRFRQGRLAESEKLLREAYALFDDSEVAAHLGEVLWLNGKKEEARSILQEGLKKEANAPVILEVQQRLLK
ncbi:MAG: hypothetical protein RLZZ502_913 [Pseudomonadota bacterium]